MTGGSPDRRAPLILLHGLTFDRTMWRPALAELGKIDPGRRVLAVDLPVTASPRRGRATTARAPAAKV